MTGRFTVLASGSSGNAALLEANGFGLLIDCGLHPKALTARLAEVAASWASVHAVIITHTHTDHWKDLALADLRSRRIPLWAHPAHFDHLAAASPSFEALDRAGLAHAYQDAHPHDLAPGLRVTPVRVSHDSDPTFAFRVDAHDAGQLAWSVGYASDLGCASRELIEAFAGVDVLALEYNHDLKLERSSKRPRHLVERVLGDRGHLSNDQAAEVTRAVALRSGDGFPGHLVQLHLSRDCNRPELASASGRAALALLNPRSEVITARQDTAAKSIPLLRRPDALNRTGSRTVTPGPPVAVRRTVQPALPGFEA
ncbi:MBL fold metallo-hydrolase [Gemmata sp.]|uniref:MBL fold metallo-hydrolase n=1 Tax=Gemmata sp. TaxID=1914242 RepID=UPI003F72F7C2